MKNYVIDGRTVEVFGNIEQGTEEWVELRRGILTASTMRDIITPAKLQPVKSGSKFVLDLLAQRITGVVDVGYISDDMIRGMEGEIFAREIYSERIEPVEEIGFFRTVIEGVTIGYSPDGVVGDDGLIEIKSRRDKYHIETIIADDMPNDYMMQVQTGLLVTGRKWLDYISYASGMPFFVKRIYPDKNVHEKIIQAAIAVEHELNELYYAYCENSKGLFVTKKENFSTGDVIL